HARPILRVRDDRRGGTGCADSIRLQGAWLPPARHRRFLRASAQAHSKRATSGAIEQVRSAEMAVRLGRVTRTHPIASDLLRADAPFRQYVALDGANIVGRVRSVDAVEATWCADMYVSSSHRRRGIGQALLSRMMRDDRAHGSKCSVLTASHTGALLYPRVGYERIGTLFMFVPGKPRPA